MGREDNFLGIREVSGKTEEHEEHTREKTRERERESKGKRVKCLRKLAQTEGKGKDAHTLAHVPETEDPQIADRATKVAKRTVKTHAAY